jgi:mannose-1-phosphate guanylyltransferase
MKILIMAGGSSERFWPLSSKERPKQLLPLLSNKTMIRETIDRLDGLVTLNDIFISTNAIQVDNLKNELSEFPEENIIVEPAFRDTAAAILYGSTFIASRNNNPVIVILASDHAIKDIPNFHNALNKANNLAQRSNKIVTLGIKPSYPEVGYGYIKVKNTKILSVNKNVQFVEKPSIEQAQKYLKDGIYLWNSGMFIFEYNTLVHEFKIHSNQHLNVLNSILKILSSCSNIALSNIVKDKFEKFPKISIDFAIMEKSKNVICLPTDFGWDDVGSFDSLWNYVKKNKSFPLEVNKNITKIDSNKNFIILNSKNLKLNLIDVKGFIIIENNNELLIIKKHSSQKVKDILKLKK